MYHWDETDVEVWFLNNYQKFGFQEIKRIKTVGDYLALRNGKWLRVELEAGTTGFFQHKKSVRNQIDVIVCWRKQGHFNPQRDVELSQKELIVIENLPEQESLKMSKSWFFNSYSGDY